MSPEPSSATPPDRSAQEESPDVGPAASAKPVPMPARVFIIEMAYLIALIVLLIVYKTDDPFRDALPPPGPLPIQIAWFGATGAVLAGIGGIYFHNQTWNHSPMTTRKSARRTCRPSGRRGASPASLGLRPRRS